MHRRSAQLSLFVVGLLVGMLFIGQLRSQARPVEVATLSAQQLSELIETLSTRNRELRSGLADIREQLREYRVSGPQSQSALQVGREDLRRITAFAGLAAVDGQGIVMDVRGTLDAIALNDLVNELRNAGAEAISVDAIRITASSVATQGPRALVIDGVDVGEHFILRAIGSPEGLAAALDRPGGVIAQLEQFISATIVVSPSTALSIPGTARDLAPAVAQPVE